MPVKGCSAQVVYHQLLSFDFKDEGRRSNSLRCFKDEGRRSNSLRCFKITANVPTSIKVYPSDFQIKSWARASDGTWSDEKETALDVKIPKEASAEGIADAILQHLSQRNDLLGLAT
jgi:hypothetical protein